MSINRSATVEATIGVDVMSIVINKKKENKLCAT